MKQRAYYNEIDPFAAQWLRNLIAAGLIADGDVDERSIEDVRPNDLRRYTQCHFFAGIGVWSHALRRSGWEDGRSVWTGSCPCQPFSTAGKGAGFTDERHLWPAFFHLIEQCKPSVVFGEQVASSDGLTWIDLVQADMEVENYAFGAVDICAAGVGAPHIRQRMFWVADSNDKGLEGWREPERQRGTELTPWKGSLVGNTRKTGGFWRGAEWVKCRDGLWRPVEPGTFPLADGSSERVGRIHAYGNAIVSEAAQAFIKSYRDAVEPGWCDDDL
jgi:DNA (cytosine-5)-methyltransferase 1